MARMTFEEAVKRYGELDIENRSWPNESKFMTVVKLPPELIFPNLISFYTNKPVEKFYCNVDMTEALLTALRNVKDRGFAHELVSFDGLFNVRFVRGWRGRPSTHAYGLAIDLNASENPLNGPVQFSEGFISCWTDAGFTAGASFSRADGQHFSYAWE